MKDLNYGSCYFSGTRSVERAAGDPASVAASRADRSPGVSSSFKRTGVCQGPRYCRDHAMSSDAGHGGHGYLRGPVTVHSAARSSEADGLHLDKLPIRPVRVPWIRFTQKAPSKLLSSSLPSLNRQFFA